VKRFAADVIAPKVKAMDESEQMDTEIISSLFENGVKIISCETPFIFLVDGNRSSKEIWWMRIFVHVINNRR
jgi:hypothetical protein